MDKVVFELLDGGLKDSLQYSTLPEEFFVQKGIPIFLQWPGTGFFANYEIFDLVWANNPYFKGFTDDPPNAGQHYSARPKEHDDYIYRWEESHNLIATNHFPKIYPEVKSLNECELLIDLTTNSLHSLYEICKERVVSKVFELIELYKCTEYCVVEYGPEIRMSGSPIMPIIDVPGSKKIHIKNLMENSRTIKSAKHYICLSSGTSLLASAVRDKNTKNIDVLVLDYKYHWVFNNQNQVLF